MSAKTTGVRRKAASSRKRPAKKIATVDVADKVLVVDKRLCEATDDGAKLTECLAKQERRGYTIKILDLEQMFGPGLMLLLSAQASWWTPKFWPMLDAKVKGREKETSK